MKYCEICKKEIQHRNFTEQDDKYYCMDCYMEILKWERDNERNLHRGTKIHIPEEVNEAVNNAWEEMYELLDKK